jgi:hypothetical protein
MFNPFVGLRPIGIKLRASLTPPRVIEDGQGVLNDDAGDRLASPVRGERSLVAKRARQLRLKAIPEQIASPV